MTDAFNSALAGLKVIDFTSMMAGPLCARYLADLGAHVTKIEPPAGDYMRTRAPLRAGRSAYFAHLNAGKVSETLNLKSSNGLERAKELIAGADILIESFRPGTMSRLGLGPEAMSELNPQLIYCSVSGFGQNGPLADRPAYAQSIHALSGFDMAHMSYQKHQDAPQNSVLFVADTLGAAYGLSAILVALRQRDLDGRGHHIDLSLLDTMFNLMVYEVQEAQFPQPKPRPSYEPVRTLNGFLLIAPTTPKNFLALCEVLDRRELGTDPRFATVEARYENWDALMGLLQEWASSRTTSDCEAALVAAGVPCGRYNTVAEAIADPNLGVYDRLAVTSDDSGDILVPRLPYRIDRLPISVQKKVP